jgi:hypothetical protein
VKVDPQFKSGKYTAALLPLGQRVEDGDRVTRFALSLNLPKNCFSTITDKAHGRGDCVDFTYTAVSSPRSAPEGGVRASNNVVELQGTRGVSVLEMTSPQDAETVVVAFSVGDKRLALDPATGEVVGG